ncbi:MAG: hypothetical protein IKO94_04160, partial [Selenomonadaceae bacterium]|nr:hypothetical protein [Selenomonadaceae bacterium]
WLAGFFCSLDLTTIAFLWGIGRNSPVSFSGGSQEGGRWWDSNPATKSQEEIDLIVAGDGQIKASPTLSTASLIQAA